MKIKSLFLVLALVATGKSVATYWTDNDKKEFMIGCFLLSPETRDLTIRYFFIEAATEHHAEQYDSRVEFFK